MNLFKKNKKTEPKDPEAARPRMASHPELKMADTATSWQTHRPTDGDARSRAATKYPHPKR